jgi:RNA polymerase sigma-70 factor (ECF subfamily)
MTAETDETARSTAETIARQSYGKLIAYLAARTRDVAAAEDALSEAFAAALADWPVKGCPTNPEAWLLAVARRKIVDRTRGRRRDEVAAEALKATAEGLEAAAAEAQIPDQRLALMVACAHPSIEPPVRAPLILQAVLGLNAKTIASAYLTSPAAMSKRLVRAKEKIRQAAIPWQFPEREDLQERVDAVLDAVYAAFTEGWTDPGGTDAVRRDLTEEAILLARLATELLPAQPEAMGLLALMLHAHARRFARRDATGEYVPLAQQNPAAWDSQMIAEAESLLLRASTLRVVGRFQLEAALQSAHVFRCRTGRANWEEIVQLYDSLFAVTGSPVAAINRALAIAEFHGAEAGLVAMPILANDARLAEYQPFWAARAELLAKSGDSNAAAEAYETAAGLERDSAVRRFLLRRRAMLYSADALDQERETPGRNCLAPGDSRR